MVAIDKYHDTAQTFLAKVEEDGKELRICDRAIYIYEDGAWGIAGPGQLDALDRILFDASADHSFPYAEKYAQLWRYVRSSLPVIDPNDLDAKGFVALPNGTLDPLSGTLYSHDPDHLTTRKAAVEYKPAAKCPRWEKMLERMLEDKNESTRKQYKDFLQQWFGLALVGYRNHSGRQYRKLLALYGPERTGKTTIADVLRKLIGESDIASEDVDELCQRFGLANVVRARAIVSDDAAGLKSKMQAKTIKKLITGEPMTADRKMRDTVSFRFQGPILITVNALPEVKDATHALYGRCVVLTLERQFSDADAVRDLEGHRNIIDMLAARKEFPGILNWALKGLARVLEAERLPDVTDAVDAANAWREENDPVYAFLREHCEFDASVLNYQVPVSAAISVYAEMQHADRTYTPRRVRTLLGREARNVVVGVQTAPTTFAKTQVRAMYGLRLNDAGAAYIQKAREKGILGNEQWPVNQKVL